MLRVRMKKNLQSGTAISQITNVTGEEEWSKGVGRGEVEKSTSTVGSEAGGE
jgi:hypothetical protein